MSETKLAKILSVLFHPLLMPTYGLIIYFQIQGRMGVELIPKAKWMLLFFIFTMTFVIPLSLTLAMKRLGVVKSLEMPTAKERIIPLFFTALVFIITYYALVPTGIFPDYQIFILGTAQLVLTALVISLFTKISIHMMGIGGLTGALIALGIGSATPVIHHLNLAILISGLVGFSRLRLNAHKDFQIYFGYLLGVLVMAGLFLLI